MMSKGTRLWEPEGLAVRAINCTRKFSWDTPPQPQLIHCLRFQDTESATRLVDNQGLPRVAKN